jgi:hypothetical protein
MRTRRLPRARYHHGKRRDHDVRGHGHPARRRFAKATIGADGAFAIDGKAVSTTPAERSLLVRYNQSVRSVHETGLAMGKTGIETAVKAVKDKLSSAPDQADKAASGAGDLKKLILDICKAEAAIKDAQDQLAVQLAAFKPYASIVSAADVTDCENGAKD